MFAVDPFSTGDDFLSKFTSIVDCIHDEEPARRTASLAVNSNTAFSTMKTMMTSKLNATSLPAYLGYSSSPSNSIGEPEEFVQQSVQQPRSAGELVYDSSPKFRQLPCRTFISVGTCPYRERCVYLHDPRIICREAKTKTRRKNKEDTVSDSYYWPIMSFQQVAGKLDANRQPHVIQPYIVPPAVNDEFTRHDEAVHSLWMHFVDLCAATAASTNIQDCESMPCYMAPDIPTNAYTKLPRLQVFRALSASNGRTLSREQLLGLQPVIPVPGNIRQRKVVPLPAVAVQVPPQPRMPLIRSDSPNAVTNVLSPSHFVGVGVKPQPEKSFFSREEFASAMGNMVPRHRLPMFF
jgi:hypothetical protein